jgi:hypothetical protein
MNTVYYFGINTKYVTLAAIQICKLALGSIAANLAAICEHWDILFQ